MRIAQVKITNLLGIQNLEFDAGQFNEVSGSNGKGKSSVLSIIQSAMKGGHDATLLRQGAEKGEAVIVLDDGTEIHRTETADGKSATSVRQAGKKVAKPVDALKRLSDMVSVNPVSFLLADGPTRTDILLKTMPLPIDHDKLAELAGYTVDVADGTPPLQVIAAYRKHVYDERTGTNRAIKEKSATINQLEAAMPSVPEGAADGDENALQAGIDDANQKKQTELDRISNKLDGIRQDHAAKEATARQEAQAQIDKIKSELAVKVDDINKSLNKTEQLAATQRENTISRHAAHVQPLRDSLNAFRTNRDAMTRRASTQATIAEMNEQLTGLEADAAQQTAAIEALDAHKMELLAGLPIPGLEVRDGEIYRHGVHFDRLNTAQQVEIAVEIAKLRAGTLPLICVDRIECLDSDHYAAFKQQSIDSGMQLFVSRVTDGDFAIATE